MKRYVQKFIGFFQNRNLVPKMASILLSVILWAYISSSKSGDIKFKLPVAFEGLEENYIVSKTSHKYIVVEVQGNKDELKNLRPANFKLTVDLAKATPGDYKPYKIQYQKIDLTDDFKVELNPEEIKVFIEKKFEKNVKIIPKYSGYTEKGFMTGKIRVIPEYVKISGPRSLLNNTDAVYTDEISVDGRNSTFRQDVKIQKINEDELQYNISRVNVFVPILNYSQMTTYEIPVAVKNRKKGFKYTISPLKIKISVVSPENKNINEHSYSAYIDANEIDIENDEFLIQNRIETIGFVHVVGDSSEADNGILSSTPESIRISVTRE